MCLFKVKVFRLKKLVETGTSNSEKVPDLENIVGVAVYPTKILYLPKNQGRTARSKVSVTKRSH